MPTSDPASATHLFGDATCDAPPIEIQIARVIHCAGEEQEETRHCRLI
jgi:hypothetical protein